MTPQSHHRFCSAARCLSLFWLLACQTGAFAQPSLERLFPPAVTIGQATLIQLEGKFEWPVEIYCDRSDIELVAGEEKGALRIEVPSDAPPGVAWIRILDASGVSDPKPLCIREEAVEAEKESNDDFESALTYALPSNLCGRLEKKGDVDCFRIRLQANEWLHANLLANRVLQSPMDSVLQLVDAHGHILAQSDDQLGLDPQLSYHSKVEQELMIRLFCFPETPNSTIGFAGGQDFAYVLSLGSVPEVDHFLPLHSTESASPLVAFSAAGPVAAEPAVQIFPATELSPPIAYAKTSSPAADGAKAYRGGWQWLPPEAASASVVEGSGIDKVLQPPALFSGHISCSGEVDEFQFAAEAGTNYEIRAHCQVFGFPLDSTLTILDDQGKPLASNDDLSRRPYDAGINWKAERTSVIRVQVRDLAESGSWHHAYSIAVRRVEPRVTLSIASDHFSCSPGEDISIPVSVQRQNGYDAELAISVVDLPTGTSCEALLSPAKGEKSKSVELSVKVHEKAKKGHYRFRIHGLEDGGDTPSERPNHDEPIPCSFRPFRGIDAQLFWLTVK